MKDKANVLLEAQSRCNEALERRRMVCSELWKISNEMSHGSLETRTMVPFLEGDLEQRLHVVDLLLRIAESVSAAADASRAEEECRLACRSFVSGGGSNLSDLSAAFRASKAAEESSRRSWKAQPDGMASRAASSMAARALESVERVVSEFLGELEDSSKIAAIARIMMPTSKLVARRFAASARAQADTNSWACLGTPSTGFDEKEIAWEEELLMHATKGFRERLDKSSEAVTEFVLGAFPPEGEDEEAHEEEFSHCQMEYAREICQRIRIQIRNAWDRHQISAVDEENGSLWIRRATLLRQFDASMAELVESQGAIAKRFRSGEEGDVAWLLENGCGPPPQWGGIGTLMELPEYLEAWTMEEMGAVGDAARKGLEDGSSIEENLVETLSWLLPRASMLRQNEKRKRFLHQTVEKGFIETVLQKCKDDEEEAHAARLLRACGTVLSQLEDEPYFLELYDASEAWSDLDEGTDHSSKMSPLEASREGTPDVDHVFGDLARSLLQEADRHAESVAQRVSSRFRKEARSYVRRVSVRLSQRMELALAPDPSLLHALYQLDEDLQDARTILDAASYRLLWRVVAASIEELLQCEVLGSAKEIGRGGARALEVDFHATRAALESQSPTREHSGIPCRLNWRALEEAISTAVAFYDPHADLKRDQRQLNGDPDGFESGFRWLDAGKASALHAALLRGRGTTSGG